MSNWIDDVRQWQFLLEERVLCEFIFIIFEAKVRQAAGQVVGRTCPKDVRCIIIHGIHSLIFSDDKYNKLRQNNK